MFLEGFIPSLPWAVSSHTLRTICLQDYGFSSLAQQLVGHSVVLREFEISPVLTGMK